MVSGIGPVICPCWLQVLQFKVMDILHYCSKTRQAMSKSVQQ